VSVAKGTGGSVASQQAQAPAARRPRVLVLLASRNGEKWITEQIRSILEQRSVDVEIAVRDDASTDQTRSRIASFAGNAPVRLTCCEAPTGSAAQNYFALIRENPADSFDFVALSDQDDTWRADKLSRACGRLSGVSEAGYSSATVATWSDGKSVILRQADRKTSSDFLFGGIGQGCTFVLTRDFYHRCRDFLTSNPHLTGRIHYHDWALYALARAWQLRWFYDPAPSVTYRQHGQNDTGARSSIAGLRKRLMLIRRGWYAEQVKAIAALCAAAKPSDPMLRSWNALLTAPDTWPRRLRITRFCALGGRRSLIDNTIVMLAALCGRL
jgi:rhamnosyltransferase